MVRPYGVPLVSAGTRDLASWDFFGGSFNQDWMSDHATPSEAIDEYVRLAAIGNVAQLLGELVAIASLGLTDDEVETWLVGVNSYHVPTGEGEAAAFVDEVIARLTSGLARGLAGVGAVPGRP